MINKSKNIIILFLGIVFFYSEIIFSQVDNQSIDQVPRDRLVTDHELFQLIDFSKINSIKNSDNINFDELAEYFRNRKSPSYFFSTNSLVNEIDKYLNLFPDEQVRIKESINKYESTYGGDIDWLLPGSDLYGRSLTPNTIRYVARFPLAYEYSIASIINPEIQSRVKLFVQLRDFVEDYEKGDVESEENDVFERFYAGHRTRNLLFAHNVMLADKNYSLSDQIYMLKVFLLHGAKLIDVCKDFHWGNHQLHGLAGLYEMTSMYPEFPIMKQWNAMALNTIMEHIEKEIMADGFQFERASHYYKLDIMNYFRIYQISKINNLKLPDLFEERFHKMFDAFVNLSLPSRSLPVLQDAQNKYESVNSNLENNDAAELSDPSESIYMTIGSTIFKDEVYKYFGSQILTSELFWFFSEDERTEYANLKPSKPLIGSVGLESSNYYVMRSGWERDSYYLLIDGGLAKYKPDHTHGGILGIYANVNGEDVLPTYRVRYSEPTYRYLKNSYIKNVALADNIVQGQKWKSNNARTGFGHWEELPQPKVSNWLAGDNYDFFSGSHDGYLKQGVEYTRSVIFFKPNFWLVIDDYKSESLHSYQQLWQGEYEILTNVNGIVKRNGDDNFYIIQSDFADTEIIPYSKFGYSSVMFEKKGKSNYTFSTILYPTKGLGDSEPIIREYERDDYKQITVQNGSLKSCYYFNKGEILKLDEIETDAQFVCANYENDILKSYMAYQGNYCSLDGAEVRLNQKSTFEISFNTNNELVYKIIK